VRSKPWKPLGSSGAGPPDGDAATGRWKNGRLEEGKVDVGQWTVGSGPPETEDGRRVEKLISGHDWRPSLR
jgi:hypothetical protein